MVILQNLKILFIISNQIENQVCFKMIKKDLTEVIIIEHNFKLKKNKENNNKIKQDYKKDNFIIIKFLKGINLCKIIRIKDRK